MNRLLATGVAFLDVRLVAGQDCRLRDEHGREYLDFESAVWCTPLGHSHPRVTRVIEEQAGRLLAMPYRFRNPAVDAAAERLLAAVGMPEGRCLFLSAGSEAVEFGVQAVRRLRPAPFLLTLTGSYLAAYGSAGTLDPARWQFLDWSACAGCPLAATCRVDCPRLQEIPWDAIAGLVFEPGNSSGTVRLPPAGLVRMLVSLVRQAGGLVMVNEVTTGVGRTGRWFGHQHYGIEPDVVAVGKGLGNGFPISAVVLGHGIAQELTESAFVYGQSHQNNPLGCAVAAEVLDVVREEGLVERSDRVGAWFLDRLRELSRRRPVIRACRGRGLMIAVELDVAVDPVAAALLRRGFLVGRRPADGVLRFYPPLTIGEDEIEQLVATLDEVLAAAGTPGSLDMPGSTA